MQKLTIGFSPCPNDTFIFDALIHQKIDTEGLSFEVCFADVEELNSKAFKAEFDITKLSYHAMTYCLNHYQLLNSGSALGEGVGPLLVAKKQLTKDQLQEAIIGIPGKYTTANFLLSIAYPNLQHKKEMLFSSIEEALLDDSIDAGLIIHENRFTYESKDLVKIIDLGEYWESYSDGLIPLGGIVVNRNFDQGLKEKIDRLIKKSIEFAFGNRESSKNFVKEHSQEMDDEVIEKHINLYVNQYSLDLGIVGRKAVQNLFKAAIEKRIVKHIKEPIFV